MIATKYPKVDKLPGTAQKVSLYAKDVKIKHYNYVYVLFDRYQSGKGSDPGFKIVNWQGSNYVIPD